jgi:glycosyltransferase involved in cell wall biosynthesis
MISHQPALPQISVALCVCNGAHYLRELLDSVLAQTGVHIEVVAVDDCSTDDSLALLHDYAARDARLRVVANAQNLGPRRNFEQAMALCRSEFIAPCDQDDIWQADKLQRLFAAIGSADLAYCDSAFIDAQGVATGARVSDGRTMLHGHAPLRFVFANSVSGHAALLRRDLFTAARPFPDGVYHDWWLAMRAAMRSGIVYLDEPLVQFRRHDAAFSTLGRPGSGRVPSRHQLWLEDRRRLLDVYCAAAAPCPAAAAELRRTLDRAIADGSRVPLLRALWRVRPLLAEQDGDAWLAMLRMQLRFLRKLWYARREPPIAPRQL